MQPAAVGRPIDSLLVEDNPGDARLTIAALAFLRRDGVHAQAVRPDLVLLDLNLPRKDGREVLAEIKADSQLHRPGNDQRVSSSPTLLDGPGRSPGCARG